MKIEEFIKELNQQENEKFENFSLEKPCKDLVVNRGWTKEEVQEWVDEFCEQLAEARKLGLEVLNDN